MKVALFALASIASVVDAVSLDSSSLMVVDAKFKTAEFWEKELAGCRKELTDFYDNEVTAIQSTEAFKDWK